LKNKKKEDWKESVEQKRLGKQESQHLGQVTRWKGKSPLTE